VATRVTVGQGATGRFFTICSRNERTSAMALSVLSNNSVLSVASDGSVLSIGSAGSFLSIGSIGSAGSAFSIGSAGSLASVMSAGSIASVLSSGRKNSLLNRKTDWRQAGISIGLFATLTTTFLVLRLTR
jgi:hypothetical protein